MKHDDRYRPNKRERKIGEEIHSLAKMAIDHCLSLGLERGFRIDPELYYDEGQPSRQFEIGAGRRTSIRVGLQSNDQTPRRTCGFTIFIDGRSVDEGTFHANKATQLHPMLRQTLDTFAHLDQSFR